MTRPKAHRKATLSPELTGTDWFKSSYSGGEGDCIEVAHLRALPCHSIAVRDSKNPDGPVLLLRSAAFAQFIRYAADGQCNDTP
ncbi:DUF397 domain-containing protein [Streptomyces sp. NPDC093252]|uniref:DUF397 domain-containing protein n=1 Tax=Streptomyces sp. NPDC093252 TaxID=3154980 RepID=UPI00343DD958